MSASAYATILLVLLWSEKENLNSEVIKSSLLGISHAEHEMLFTHRKWQIMIEINIHGE